MEAYNLTVGRALATGQAATGAVGLRALVVRRAIYACLYCRPRARTAISKAAAGAVGLRALAVVATPRARYFVRCWTVASMNIFLIEEGAYAPDEPPRE